MKQPPQFAGDEARSHRSVRQHDEQREYAPAVNLRRQSVNIGGEEGESNPARH